MKDQTTPHAQAVYLNNEQIFFQSTIDGRKNGWYITVTGEQLYGPFPNKQVAQQILDGLLQRLQDKDEHQQGGTADDPRLTGHG